MEAVPLLMLATDALLAAVAVVAGITDWRARRIPNWLTLSGFIVGCAVNAYTGGWGGSVHALGGAALAFAIHLPLFLLRATGGGDVKLMTALGAILGPRDWLVLFVISAVLGGVAAVIVILSRGAFVRTLRNVGRIVREIVRLRHPHASRPELDLHEERSLTIPRGTVVACAALVLVAARLTTP
jgi:prepilin peptidase CpaA